MATYSQQVVRSFLWQGGAQAAGQAVSWVATIVVIRLLAPADYGLMAMANVFLGFLFLFSDFGFGSAVVQAHALDREQLRRILGIVVVMHLGCFAITFAAAPLLAAFFGEPRLAAVVRVLSFNFLLIAGYVIPQSRVLREMDFRLKAHIDVISVVAMAATSLLLALAGYGVWALVGGAMIINIVRLVAYNVARPMWLTPVFSWGSITRLAQFSLLMTLDRLLFFLYGQADTVIGGRVLGKDLLGLYAVALSLAVIPMEKVLPVITQVSFSAFSRIQEEPDRVRRNVLRAVQLVSLVCFPAFFGMAAVAGDLVPVVLGPRWVELVVPFQLLCLVLPLKAVAALFSPAVCGIGRPGVDVWNMTLALVVMTVSLLVGVQYGLKGICLAWVIGYPPVFIAMAWRSGRALSTSVGEFVARCAFPAVTSALMAFFVLGVRVALAPLGVSALRLAILVAAGAAVYGASVMLFQRSTVRELIAVVRS